MQSPSLYLWAQFNVITRMVDRLHSNSFKLPCSPFTRPCYHSPLLQPNRAPSLSYTAMKFVIISARHDYRKAEKEWSREYSKYKMESQKIGPPVSATGTLSIFSECELSVKHKGWRALIRWEISSITLRQKKPLGILIATKTTGFPWHIKNRFAAEN